MIIRYCTLILTFSFLQSLCFGQAVKDDTRFVNSAIQETVKVYTALMGNQNPLYIGVEYVFPFYSRTEFPFFQWSDFELGGITINNMEYSGVPLLYDVYSEKVITELGNTTIPIELISEKINSFNIKDHYFIRIDQDSANNSLPTTGFYELLYPGESMVVLHRKKNLERLIEDRVERMVYIEKQSYFVRKGASFKAIKSKKSLLKLFYDKKRELASYYRDNDLKFRQKKAMVIVSLAQFYDTLKN